VSLSQLVADSFKGREDHYAVQQSKGFAPVQRSLTPSLVEKHLSGETGLGFYTLTKDSKCYATCVDFDNHPSDPDPQWSDKAERLYFELDGMGVCPVVERSQSGGLSCMDIFRPARARVDSASVLEVIGSEARYRV
jgi:hypothetical protein